MKQAKLIDSSGDGRCDSTQHNAKPNLFFYG